MYRARIASFAGLDVFDDDRGRNVEIRGNPYLSRQPAWNTFFSGPLVWQQTQIRFSRFGMTTRSHFQTSSPSSENLDFASCIWTCFVVFLISKNRPAGGSTEFAMKLREPNEQNGVDRGTKRAS